MSDERLRETIQRLRVFFEGSNKNNYTFIARHFKDYKQDRDVTGDVEDLLCLLDSQTITPNHARAIQTLRQLRANDPDEVRRQRESWVQLEADLSCTWIYDPDGYWKTGCGDRFCITEGTPAENNMRFCHYCGGRLVVEGEVGQPDGEKVVDK